MIKNEREYEITKAQADRFREALEELKRNPNGGLHPLLQKAQNDALKGTLDDLLALISEYESLLTAGREFSVNVDSFEDLPVALIKARIASGFTQKDLADAIGVQEQQIQRYEATDYAGASIERLQEVMRALEVGFNCRLHILACQPSKG